MSYTSGRQDGGRQPRNRAQRDGGEGERPAGNKALKVILRVLAVTLKVTLSVITVILLTSLLVGGAFLYYVFNYIDPTVDINLEDMTQEYTSFVYYQDKATGQWKQLEQLYNTEDRVPVSITEVPENLKNAFIAIEDKRFREHEGVDWQRTLGAVYGIATGTSTFGGSSITQQLIKCLTGDDDVTIKRKITEIMRALEFEKRYSKDQILEAYLNTVPLGGRVNGVGSAAKKYFDKEVSQLTLAECACIAGITQYPSKYNPFLHPDNNIERQRDILFEMHRQELITDAEYEQAKAQKIVFATAKAAQESTSIQSYYVDQIISDVLKDMQERKGYSETAAINMLYGGGLQIYACIDMDVQAIMDDVYENDENFPEVRGPDKLEAAMVVMDPEDGRLLGIRGGRGVKTAARTLNRATQSYRSPGSSIKPIAVYAPAIDYGIITGGSVYDDSPVRFNPNWPKNSTGGGGYQGLMTIKRAVQLSTNTIAVRVLDDLGVDNSIKFMREKLHITSLVDATQAIKGKFDADLSVALGGLTKGISVREITAAYVPFVNEGLYARPRTYEYALDHKGDMFMDNKPELSRAIYAETANLMTALLENAVQNGTGTPAKISGMSVAGKTGTTTNDHDRWFVGYTPYYVAGSWVGFDQQKEIKISGNNPAVILWQKVMSRLVEGKEDPGFSRDGLVQASYCMDSGMKPSTLCGMDIRGGRSDSAWFVKGTEPAYACDRHIEVTLCGDTNQIAGPYCPEAGLHRSALVNFLREYPFNIAIGDAQYTFIPTPPDQLVWVDGPAYQAMLTPGMLSGYSGGDYQVNFLCTLHTTEQPKIDAYDPSTWPEGFSPYDPLTWPEGFDPATMLNWPPDPNDPRYPILPTDPTDPTDTYPSGGDPTDTYPSDTDPWDTTGPDDTTSGYDSSMTTTPAVP